MANKKISELPLIQRISGSVGYLAGDLKSVIPIVVAGTTTQMIVEDFSKFVNAYNAHTGSAGNTFKGPQTIQSTLSVTGNTTIGGTLVVAGRLTAEEFHTEITTASVIYSSGSTKFGDDTGDKHEFTGSINVSGSLIYNGVTLLNIDANTVNRLQQTTASLNTFTASQDIRNFTLSQVTASFAGEIGGLEAYTASLKAVSVISGSSQLPEIGGIEAYTASLKAAAIVSSSTQIQNYDVFALNSVLYIATGSIKGEISGIEAYTASLKTAAIVSSSTQIQNYDVFALNSNLYTSTGSIKGEIAGIESYTASLKTAAIVSSSTQVQNYDLFALNSNLYIATGSLIGITNGLMAFTAALDNTYATDAQLYELYAATASLNTATGSIKGEIAGIESYTASLKNAISVSGTNVQIIGDLNVNKLNVQYISSSILVTSGSNIFGDQSTDKHEFTGSVAVSGKLYVNDSATNFLIEGNGFSQTYLTSNGAMVLNPGFGGVEMVGSYRTFKATDITADGFVSGEIRANNNILSGSGLTNYIPMYNGTTALSSSIIFQSTGSIAGIGKAITIGSDVAMYKFAVNPIANTYFGIGYTDTDSVFMTAVDNTYLPKPIVYSAQSYKWYATSLTSTYELGMIIQSSSLNVGFGGIENPLHKVDISGSVRVSNGLVISGSSAFTGSVTATTFTGSLYGNSTTSTKATNVVGAANRILFNNATDTTTTSANLAWNGSALTVNGDISFGYASTLKSTTDPTNNISLHDGTFGIIKIRNNDVDKITINRNSLGGVVKISGSLVVDSNSPTAIHEITGSLNVSGSSHTIQNGYVILQQVSASLNFADDTAAAAGGVPLGGLYRSGNFIVIRIV